MLNEMQQKAVDSTADKVVVIAGAGSGKTHILIERLTKLKESGVDPESILVLTFTNAAAQEMTDRYRNRNNGDIRTPKFGTFHAFCYSLILGDTNVRNALGYHAPPNIAAPEDIKRIKNTAKLICGTKLSDKALDTPLKDLKGVTDKVKFEYEVYHKQYNKLLRKESLITFDIMCYDVCELFKADAECIKRYKTQYQYVVADEFQDTDISQAEFMWSFKDSKLFVVGDFRQALYSFRGADSSLIKSLATNPEWETIVLSQNYRSTKEICDFANKIHHFPDSKLNINMQSERSGLPIQMKSELNLDDTDVLLRIAEEKTDDNTVAILARTNAEVVAIKECLKGYGIPYIENNSNNVLADLLMCSIDSDYCVEYLSNHLSQEEYLRYLRMKSTSELTEEQFITYFGSNFRYSLTKIMDIRRIMITNPMISIVFVELVKYLKINIDIAEGLKCNNLNDVVRVLSDYLNSTSDKGIYVGTIHSSKGLEYDIVHVYGVNSKAFNPYKNEDERNCYYVACTRAKEKLVIWDSTVHPMSDVEEFGYGKYHIE